MRAFFLNPTEDAFEALAEAWVVATSSSRSDSYLLLVYIMQYYPFSYSKKIETSLLWPTGFRRAEDGEEDDESSSGKPTTCSLI